ncbi:MAG: methionine synthase [Alphaproteobacteria bacterium]|nr:methionine synthase [Alphaproteobacteria bacterium]
MAHLLDYLRDRVLLLDGAIGSEVQDRDLDVDRDYLGHENCTEILTKSRPDLVRDIHLAYLEAGADAVETNTFGGSPTTLGEFGLAEDAFALNQRAAELAREAIAECARDGRERFVFGAIGPGTKLPSLGHISYREVEEAIAIQASGLIAGAVDALLIETCQDTLQVKAAVNGAKRAREAAGVDIPLLVQVTVEMTGTLLVGADIAAAATVVDALDVPVIGLNCATGPQEMAEHVKWLGENWPGPISILPNAGLPELVDGQARYPLSADGLAQWQERFVEEDGVAIIGGCCGTGPAHIAALDAMLRRRAKDGTRPRPVRRNSVWVSSLASLYAAVPLRQENAYLSIGERCNANGSRKFRELQASGDWDGCVEMGREQVREGSHALDLCTAFVGRDENAEMKEVVTRMRGSVKAPLVIDSTEFEVLEKAFELYGGKPVLNSINFEDGEAAASERLILARRFGAAVIALTIDETGMAKTAAAKVEVAKRLYDFACGRFGLPPSDLLIDPLTFTICTGNEDDRRLGLETLEAIERIGSELPECQIILGLSNISFGINPAAREVLNSVFLDHALRRGMTGAIVHFSKIMPLHKIAEEEAKIAEDLIYDRSGPGYDPLQAFMGLFQDRKAQAKVAKQRAEKIEDRLKDRIIDGDKQGLEAELDDAMKQYPPLDIINTFLLDGMKVVGDLFGSGQKQLPFVLQSAETMKRAVSHLEPFMDRVEGQHKGTVVLATVKGDVHDIGKNLVDIILTNNGYNVVNLGIKQPIANILEAAREHDADAIGMSGLLVKSTVVMRQNLAEMSRQELDIPVLLGGAALTRRYVEEDCRSSYDCGRVAYARDAFDGLKLCDAIKAGGFDDHLNAAAERRKKRPVNTKRKLGAPGESRPLRPVDSEEIRLRRAELRAEYEAPTPPFWGAKIIESVNPQALLPYLNERMLYQFHWGYQKNGRELGEYMDWARNELRPIMRRVLDQCTDEDAIQPRAAYGYWKAAADGDDLVLFDADGDTERARFSLPRQAREGGLCIADFFREADSGERDVIALQVVTIGQKASDVARQWFADDRYQDYLYLHGLGVELAEAMAEYVHKTVRSELGFGADDARDIDKLLQQNYRGSRYSFGYPACPNLHDQRQLLTLLDAGQIGVDLSDEDQLHPEQSTSAIVVSHPQAKYFSV